MLHYEFMIIQDWELMSLNLFTLTWILATLTFQMRRIQNVLIKFEDSLPLAIVLYPFNWTAKNVGEWDYKNNFPSSQHSLSFIMVLVLAHRHYQHTGIISRAWIWFPQTLSVVFNWNFHVAQNISLSLEQYRHQKHVFWKHVLESMADTK